MNTQEGREGGRETETERFVRNGEDFIIILVCKVIYNLPCSKKLSEVLPTWISWVECSTDIRLLNKSATK